MRYMQTVGIKSDKPFFKNLAQYFTDRSGSDGSVVKGLRANQAIYPVVASQITSNTVIS